MAATQGEHAIRVFDIDTPASEAKDGGFQDLVVKFVRWCCLAILWLGVALLIAFSLVLMVAMIGLIALDGYPTEYSAAITGAAAVAPGELAPNAVPALFNLTVRIRNPSRLYARCVWSDATAVVSYGGAAIGAGTVPWFCAGKTEEREVTVPLWGVGAGADVTLPAALQRREAPPVDVAVRMPKSQICRYEQVLTCSSVKVGGRLSPCTSACD